MDIAFSDGSISLGTFLLLLSALGLALGFEFVNGFHDTANAVATVIYTKALEPRKAVIWSGFCNFCGVMLFGVGVAFSIVHLLPVDLLINVGGGAGMAMVLALLASAITWNLGTWYLGLPASSSHTLIGAILGVGLTHSALDGHFGEGVNRAAAIRVGLSLLISPLIGFVLAAALLILLRRIARNPELDRSAQGDAPPPGWIRALLLATCSGVSFFHGSNDGQKGIGLIMLILIGILPGHYALDRDFDAARAESLVRSIDRADEVLRRHGSGFAAHGLAVRQASFGPVDPELGPMQRGPVGITPVEKLRDQLDALRRTFASPATLRGLSQIERKALRAQIIEADSSMSLIVEKKDQGLSEAERATIEAGRSHLRELTDYAPGWVKLAVALALGIGTMFGWKRIVVTVGEKIGKSHLTYAQGAAAELVAMGTIGLADLGGLPVSTTHVLSSGVAGTMVANGSGVQGRTIRNIALAWVLTLPASMLLAGVCFVLFRMILH